MRGHEMTRMTELCFTVTQRATGEEKRNETGHEVMAVEALEAHYTIPSTFVSFRNY